MSDNNKILVIDDEQPILMMLEDILDLLGFEMVGAVNAAEAMEKIKEHEYKYIVCDLSLPDSDGRTLYTKIAESYPQFSDRFIFSSGHLQDSDLLEFCEGRNIKFLGKPFKIEDIQKLLV